MKCIPTGTGFATSSIEGRVAVDYFDADPEVQAQKVSLDFIPSFPSNVIVRNKGIRKSFIL